MNTINIKLGYLKTLIPLLVLVFAFSNCEDALKEELFSNVDVEDFYSSEQEANLALNGVYVQLWNDVYRDGQMISLSDVAGGIMVGGGSANGSGDRSGIDTEWNTFTWTADANELFTAWGVYFAGINRVNFLLDGIAESSISDGVKSSISGQAKFLRGLFYFHLVRFFGGVPIYIEPTKDLSAIDKPRNTEDEVYDQIIKDLQEAASELEPYNAGDHSAGRATSAAATTLLAKVYLQRGDWQNAAAEAKKVMDMDAFSLMEDYQNINSPDFNNNNEIIFSIQHGGTSNETSSLFQTRMIYLFGPPQQSAGGEVVQFHRLKDLVIFQARGDVYDEIPDTYRKWCTVRNRMPYYYTEGLNTYVDDTVQMYAPFVIKYHYLNQESGQLREGVDFPILRYSDVLLTYAEAINETSGGPTVEAYEAINLVRRRARGVGTMYEQDASIYPDLSGLDQTAFREAILDERMAEFMGEGHFRWDLIRHDALVSFAQGHGISGASDKHNLFPIPSSQTSINLNLEQNPGYTE